MPVQPLMLQSDRYFDPNSPQKDIALSLYETVKDLPLICPHGHIDPQIFSEEDYRFESPVDLLLLPDHYIFRMLYSQGISLETQGIPRLDGQAVEQNHHKIWQTFANHYYLFQGTPTGMWLDAGFYEIFGIREKLNGETAQSIYQQIADVLSAPEFTPRQLYHRFNIEVLCTTDNATDKLEAHQQIRDLDWDGTIRPTFRPDNILDIKADNWQQEIETLSDVSGINVTDYGSYIEAIEQRRAYFKAMGARATDHGVFEPFTEALSKAEVETIFQKALACKADATDARRFMGHMLMEMARMSCNDGLVMQIHPGSWRNHNTLIYDTFGANMGNDIPVSADYTRNLLPLLNVYGSHNNFKLILFTLDETTYGRELAPLAGHYPSVFLGPPWWFFDSWNGMTRFFDQVMETAGVYNTVGFNDDIRSFPAISARHDVWRRASANWLANLVVRHIIDQSDAENLVHALAYDLPKRTYNL